jgi:hypothetical protein
MNALLSADSLIDVKAPIRGVPFASLRDLVVYLSTYGPVTYTTALDLVTKQGIITSVKSPGTKLRKSSFYHYWKALDILQFINASPDDKLYRLTPDGERLAKSASSGAVLSPQEKLIFRHAMLKSRIVWRNFLSLFTGSITPIAPLPLGNRVSFKPLPSARLKRSEKYRRVSISSPHLDKDIDQLDGRLPQMIVTGLRQWSLQCDLIDEIVPPSTSTHFAGVSEFMYLLDESKLEWDTTDFAMAFRRYAKFGTVVLDSILRFDIPELISNLCLREGIKVSAAQKFLVSWISQSQHDIALERPSRALVDNQRGRRNKVIRDPRQPWLVINGAVYTTMLAKRTLFDPEGGV